MKNAILFSEMRPDSAWEDEFNTWYEDDHIPVRMVIPGFEGAQRYRAADSDDYLVVYDLDSLDVLKTPAYQKVKNEPSEQTRWMLENVSHFTRSVGTLLGHDGAPEEEALEAPLIFTARFNVPDEDLEDFDNWMTQDHVPLLLECPDWLATRRFALKVSEPVPYNRLAIHYLRSPDALKSPERAKARDTDWRKRLGEKDWFGKGKPLAFTRYGQRHPGQ